MRNNDIIKSTTNAKRFTVVLISQTWKGKRTLKWKGDADTREAADAIRTELYARCNRVGASDTSYKVLSLRQLKDLLKEVQGEQAARRKKGAEKAANTRAKTPKEARFVCCPTCGAKSKKLLGACSESTLLSAGSVAAWLRLLRRAWRAPDPAVPERSHLRA